MTSTPINQFNNNQLIGLNFKQGIAKSYLVKLESAWQIIVNRANYSSVMQTLLGELLAASLLLQHQFKIDGRFILQIHGYGDSKLSICAAECNAELGVRGIIKAKEAFSLDSLHDLTLHQLIDFKHSYLVAHFIPNHQDLKPQQSLIGLLDENNQPFATIKDAIMHYFNASEQLSAQLCLASNKQFCAGMLLQRIPTEGGLSESQNHAETKENDWQTLLLLAKTLSKQELLELQPIDIAQRIFYEYVQAEQVLMHEEKPYFSCTCSYEKAEQSLILLLEEPSERQYFIQQNTQNVAIDCHFCGAIYQVKLANLL